VRLDAVVLCERVMACAVVCAVCRDVVCANLQMGPCVCDNGMLAIGRIMENGQEGYSLAAGGVVIRAPADTCM